MGWGRLIVTNCNSLCKNAIFCKVICYNRSRGVCWVIPLFEELEVKRYHRSGVYNEDQYHLDALPDPNDWVDEVEERLDRELGLRTLVNAIFKVPEGEAIL